MCFLIRTHLHTDVGVIIIFDIRCPFTASLSEQIILLNFNFELPLVETDFLLLKVN